MYDYRAKVERVVDGDTVHLAVDLGCDTTLRMTCRLMGINSPEMSTSEGQIAKDYVIAWLEQFGGRVRVETVKDKKEKYGRYLAYLFAPDESGGYTGSGCLNDDLVAHGHAVYYDGGKRDV